MQLAEKVSRRATCSDSAAERPRCAGERVRGGRAARNLSALREGPALERAGRGCGDAAGARPSTVIASPGPC